jgi:hypothetical protein
MKEIKQMSLDEFRLIVDEYVYENTPREQRYKPLKESQKRMIDYYKKHFKKKKKDKNKKAK